MEDTLHAFETAARAKKLRALRKIFVAAPSFAI
jgi:hypothetical protein